MGHTTESKHFEAAIALMKAGRRIQKRGQEALDEILEGSGYTDCKMDDIVSVELYESDTSGELSLIVDFSYFCTHEDQECKGSVWIKYKDGELGAEF